MATSKTPKGRVPNVKAIATRAERARPRAPRPAVRERAEETRRHAAEEKRIREVMAGLVDVGAIEQLARQREARNVQRAEAAHRRAVAASAQRARWIAAHAIPASLLTAGDGGTQFAIDTAAWIRAWPNTGALRDAHVGAGNNWGKYRLSIDGGLLDVPDEARVSFYALWQNPSDVAVTIRVASHLNVNAHVRAHADGRHFGSLFIPGASADATLRARLTATPLWLPNTHLDVASGFVGSVSARGGFLGDDDDATIFTSVFLDGALPVTVPPNRFLMLETSLISGWKIDSGNIRVDAEQGAFRIDVPWWIVTIVA
jgi:hypothetical protein